MSWPLARSGGFSFTTAAALLNELVYTKQNNQVRQLIGRWPAIRIDRGGRLSFPSIHALPTYSKKVVNRRYERKP